MSENLSMRVDDNLSWNFVSDQELSDPRDSDQQRLQRNYLPGSGEGQVNQMWRARRTVTLATQYDDLDLVGVLANVFGTTIALATVKVLRIRNLGKLGDDGLYVPTAGENLLVGKASVTPWVGLFDGDDASVPVYAGGTLRIEAPLDGIPVVAGVSDVLRIAHDGSLDDISYDIILAGIRA